MKSALRKIRECFPSCCVLFAKMPQNFIWLAEKDGKLLLLTKFFSLFQQNLPVETKKAVFKKRPKTFPQKRLLAQCPNPAINTILPKKCFSKVSTGYKRCISESSWMLCVLFYFLCPKFKKNYSLSEKDDKFLINKMIFLVFQKSFPWTRRMQFSRTGR